ncbi:uncharacterized protein HGUI_04009 [Hanseniaspora guilliermondii]|uniref:RRM domain-containing protein n=1 Tax=Hanseniaspora guilliermondii TaxID=56406 RepID=A0A1L0B5H3_9ASCO|nr:uncharacterized protein HGUI_04009 [Hanseniaspora guilliermondii]
MIDSSTLLNDKYISRKPMLKTGDSTESCKTQLNICSDNFEYNDKSVHTPSSENDMSVQDYTFNKDTPQKNLSSLQNYRYLQQNSSKSPHTAEFPKKLTTSISKLSLSSGENDGHSKPHSLINDKEIYAQSAEANYYSSNTNSSISSSLYILKIQNVPSDLTPRESHLLFALMLDSSPRSIEILQDGGEKFVKAVISDFNVAVKTAIILESKKNLFGPYFPFKSFIQLFDNKTMQQIPFNDPSFNLRINKDPRFASSTDLNQLGFVDPFHNYQLENSRFANSQNAMSNTNIWHNDDRKSISRDVPSNYLRQSMDNTSYGNISGMNDFDTYQNQMLAQRGSRTTTADIYSPPRSASGINGISNMMSSIDNVSARSKTSGRGNSLTDVPLSQLRKASLSMTTASHGTDPRMSIAAGSLDGSIMRLENYIISSKHLRNMPIIYASIPGITEADLDALARVPPPTNPADQNPPCNTLYVGNLSPDIIEADMRELFEKEEGFLRISFRSKANTKSNHGPMCFVEFEEILYAARSLARLYGVEVQPKYKTSESIVDDNDSGIKKMVGIRLSFSKNPLGVRNIKTTTNTQRSNNMDNNDYGDDSRRYNKKPNDTNVNHRQGLTSSRDQMSSNGWKYGYSDLPRSRDSGNWIQKHDEVLSDPRYTFGDNAVIFDREKESEDVYKQFR